MRESEDFFLGRNLDPPGLAKLTRSTRLLLRSFVNCSDFGGSTRAGLHGLLIRREGEFSDGAKREKVENLEGVKVASRLEESVRYVEEWNRDASSR